MTVSLAAYALTPEKRKEIKEDQIVTSAFSGVAKLIKMADSNVLNFMFIGGLMQLLYQFWPSSLKTAPSTSARKKSDTCLPLR